MSRVLRWDDVLSLVRLSRSTLKTMIARDEFPAPIVLGKRAKGFLEKEVSAWFSERAEVRHLARQGLRDASNLPNLKADK